MMLLSSPSLDIPSSTPLCKTLLHCYDKLQHGLGSQLVTVLGTKVAMGTPCPERFDIHPLGSVSVSDSELFALILVYFWSISLARAGTLVGKWAFLTSRLQQSPGSSILSPLLECRGQKGVLWEHLGNAPASKSIWYLG